MPRRRRSIKREVLPDSLYGSGLATKFIHNLMLDGKKSTAERIFYEAMEKAAKNLSENDHVKILKKVIDNVKPVLEVKSRRVGGATYQVPIDVPTRRQVSLATRWIITYARSRKGQPMVERLATELIDAYKGHGSAVKKREDTHKMAEANRAFAHYRW